MHRKPCSSSCWSTDHNLLLALACLLTLHPVLASGTPATCEHSSLVQPLPDGELSTDDKIRVSADSTRTDPDGTAVFEGDVIISTKGDSLSADSARYYSDDTSFRLQGNIRIQTGGLQLQAEEGLYDSSTDRASFDSVDFLLGSSQLRGTAGSLDTSASGSRITTLSDSRITSCPPADPDWLLQAAHIEIDHIDSYGKADDVSLQFKGITFFYLPYMEFPVGDRRRSGLLAPEWSNSNSRGFELIVPWYWNIAPDMDAVIAPHYMAKRGQQLDTQFRFLTKSTRGELESAFLAEDDVTGERRYQSRYRQTTRFNSQTGLNIDINDVSDIAYFDDFSNSLSQTSLTHLQRTASLSHQHGNWQHQALIQSFETVDASIAATDRPYRKLPQLNSRATWWLTDAGLQLGLNASFTDFDHEQASKVKGQRLNLSPQLSQLWQGAYWYIQPSLRFNHITYQLDNATDPDAINLVTSSVDSGLFFERRLDDGLIQTLEPRLYYLHTPFEDQSTSPVFDSSLPTFSFDRLFRQNRFNGGDRIGDADQLTLAVSSRIISPSSGDEFMRASLGQIVYFDDRKVDLISGSGSNTEEQSDLVAELGSQWGNWRFRSSWQWDNTTRNSERQNFLLRYQSDRNSVVNLGYRFQDSATPSDIIEQTDISFATPVTDSTMLFARWNYSLQDESNIDVIGGVGYENCCWSLRLLAQRNRIDDTTNEYDNSIMLQLVFKGLGSVTGNRLTDTLRNAIPGYEQDN